MDGKPPWDVTRASFCLVAAVISFQCVSALVAFLACVYYLHDLVGEGKFQCNKDNKLTELLAEALMAALAFAGVNRSK
jgi:hypothetical protein